MTDLSNWDFADEFTGSQAAALILGFPPEIWCATQIPVLERLQRDYGYAIERARDDVVGCCFYDGSTPRWTLLISIGLDELWRDANHGRDDRLIDWLSCDQSKFEQQKFTRISIAAWLNTTGMKSVYRFDSAQGSEPPAIDQFEIEPAESDARTEAAISWKCEAQAVARAYITKLESQDLYPPQSSIADHVAKNLRERGIFGKGGKPLTGDTIKRHALKGVSSQKRLNPSRR